MNQFLLLLTLLTASQLYTVSEPIPAVCIVPVADLLSQKLSLTKQHSLEEKYALLPLSEKQPVCLCCRATQLLFNERVTIMEQSGEQSYIEAPFWYLKNGSFQTPSSRNNRFWMLTKNLHPLSKITPEENAAIPPTNAEEYLEKVITLILPWHCTATNTGYSAGTQFIVTKEEKDDYLIKIYNPKTPSIIESAVPKKICVLAKKRTDEQKRDLFVATIKRWAQGIPDSIPYVLGGASILTTCNTPSFTEKKIVVGKTKATAFTRSEYTTTPHTGVDCAGLIRLACKVSGIPLNATNSKSIAFSLSAVAPTASAQNGDILFWRGHAAIISDIKQGLLVEARGYEHGYGLVQEIPYSVQFQGITTTQMLMNAYTTKKPIRRLDNQNHYRETITDFTILSLFPVKQTP
jgi:hypothetical protein